MELTLTTLKSIASQIEQSELEDGWLENQELEVKQGSCVIFVTYRVLGEHVSEYNYHSEVPFHCYENMSHIEFVNAEITNIEAWDEEKEDEVNIENESELKY